ncbi:MAG: SDR family oxidoreductase [Spirochaetales bacterium]|nr:SDR family oxidoreductase [Spirochaetales bacterium]
MLLKDKIALVTGGAQGLGSQIARKYIAEGAIVYICDVKEKTPEAVSLENSGKGFYRKLDVTDEAHWSGVLKEISEKHGKIDILVNNAAVNIRETIEDMDASHLDLMMDINIKGPFLGIKHIIPYFRKNGGGSIINMSSICGLVGHKYTPEAYTTTKGALTLLTKSVAVRYAKDNIRTNSIHPSTVDTPLVQELFKDPLKKKERFDEVPLGRLATGDDVSHAALFLASDASSFINGLSLTVDGGLTAY